MQVFWAAFASAFFALAVFAALDGKYAASAVFTFGLAFTAAVLALGVHRSPASTASALSNTTDRKE